MIEERHEARTAAVTAAEEAAIIVLPAAAHRDILERAGSIGATVEVLASGGELRFVVPLPVVETPSAGDPRLRRAAKRTPPAAEARRVSDTRRRRTTDRASWRRASSSAAPSCSRSRSSTSSAGTLADIIGVLVDAAHGGR